MKRVAFYTLGCKVNQYETEAMLEIIRKRRLRLKLIVEDYADVYVINTCTVTHMSDRKSRQYIRRMKKKNPRCDNRCSRMLFTSISRRNTFNRRSKSCYGYK